MLTNDYLYSSNDYLYSITVFTSSIIFLSPSLTIFGTTSAIVASRSEAFVQWAAVKMNLELIREPPHLKIQVPTAACQPTAAYKNIIYWLFIFCNKYNKYFKE